MLKQSITIGVICCLFIATAGVAVADSESLRAANAIDTPEESIEGHTINHIGVFEKGEQIEGTITGPDETYDVGLFDSSNNEIANQTGVSNTISFDSNNLDLEPGSYHMSVTNTFFEEIVPIVISGYDIDIELTEHTADDELTITAAVTETAVEGAPHAVGAVVWDDATENRTELTTNGEFSSSAEYDATVSIADFDDGYEVYVVATSDEEIYQGENEILGVGEASVGSQKDSDSGTDGSTDDSQNIDDGTDDSADESDDSDDVDESNESDESDTVADDGDEESSVIEPNTSTDDASVGSTDNGSQVDDSEGDIDDETPLPVVVPVISLLLTAFVLSKRVQK